MSNTEHPIKANFETAPKVPMWSAELYVSRISPKKKQAERRSR